LELHFWEIEAAANASERPGFSPLPVPVGSEKFDMEMESLKQGAWSMIMTTTLENKRWNLLKRWGKEGMQSRCRWDLKGLMLKVGELNGEIPLLETTRAWMTSRGLRKLHLMSRE
jgi:hypothetical protein